ncbi:MAG: NAD-dependent epimerase/dehydratase family protein [gamma proteobacterium endosymbiont of Lamellibrachia anaximandri]|nr:NAD-dependent epimerase/dehydratase family protein [gamma proteobacterium endosymbiont of Lamellibrachia anaximandri]
MKALITGANGLIGANLARELLKTGHAVRAMVRPTSDLSSLHSLPVETVNGDVLASDTLAVAMQGCDTVFHTAATFTYWGWSEQQLETLAVDGSLNVINAAQQAGVGRVVLTSSSIVLGSSHRPLVRDESFRLDEADAPPYFLAKERQEQSAFERAAEQGVELVAVCPTMSLGPHGYRLGPSNGIVVSYLSDNFRSTFPGGCNIVSVSDVAKGHILAAEKGQPGTRYLAGSENLEWSKIHQIISELCGLSGPHWKANHATSFLAAAASEIISSLTGKPPLTTRTQAKMVGRYYWYDHKKLAQLGYHPKSARRALAEAISWLATSPHISRHTRTTLTLSREVYEARRAMEREDATIRATQ